MPVTAYCQKPGCHRAWPRDPALEVACPTCKAGIGVSCRRPSGHSAFGKFNVHADRDIAADLAGAYGECPSGRCGLKNKRRKEEAFRQQKEAEAMPLFNACL